MNSTSNKQAVIVSHTHWDRAWYLPFEKFRFQLVKMIDRLIEMLSNDPEYRCFVLDGQTILLEDYLEIKPENTEILKALISNDRLQIGPWYILPDLFLVSGESIIRNLQIGHKMTQEWGSKMEVGYVPDPFGHIAQLPQILQGFGIDNFMFMRGMPDEILDQQTLLFNWDAPDGSSVKSYYMIDGYLNASNLGYPTDIGRYDFSTHDFKLAKEKIEKTVRHLSEFFPQNALLLNNGMDHMPEQPELPNLIANWNASTDETSITHGSFSDFTRLLPEAPAEFSYTGNLLGNPNHPILLSVYSTRSYLKQMNQRAQGMLEKYAEPFSSMASVLSESTVPHAILDYAWKSLLKNHPHDDICGCSADSVHQDNEVRFRQVIENGESIFTDALESMMKSGFTEPTVANMDGRFIEIMAYNPHPFENEDTFEAEIIFPNIEGEEDETLEAFELAAFDASGNRIDLHIHETEAPFLKAEFIQFTWGRRYKISLKTNLPAVGYQLIRVYETSTSLDLKKIDASDGKNSEHRYKLTWDDQGLHVTDRRLKTHFDDFLTFEFVQDNGDTYSFSRASEAIYSTLTSVKPDLIKNTYHADFNLTIPPELESPETLDLSIKVGINLTSDDRINFEVSYTNTVKNGRIRMLLPVGFKTSESLADGHFMLYNHEVTPEVSDLDHEERYKQYPGELAYPTHFQGDFCLTESDQFNTWVSNRGLHEYELVELRGSTYFAITITRAVGFLSVSNGSIRRPHAGPKIAVPEAQCLRSVTAYLAWGATIANRFEIARSARKFSYPATLQQLPAIQGEAPVGDVPRLYQHLIINDPRIQLSSYRRLEHSEDWILRVFNLSNEVVKSSAILGQAFTSVCNTDFYESWNEENAQHLQSTTLPLHVQPHQILTLRLRP